MTQKGNNCNTQISVEKNKILQRQAPILEKKGLVKGR